MSIIRLHGTTIIAVPVERGLFLVSDGCGTKILDPKIKRENEALGIKEGPSVWDLRKIDLVGNDILATGAGNTFWIDSVVNALNKEVGEKTAKFCAEFAKEHFARKYDFSRCPKPYEGYDHNKLECCVIFASFKDNKPSMYFVLRYYDGKAVQIDSAEIISKQRVNAAIDLPKEGYVDGQTCIGSGGIFVKELMKLNLKFFSGDKKELQKIILLQAMKLASQKDPGTGGLIQLAYLSADGLEDIHGAFVEDIKTMPGVYVQDIDSTIETLRQSLTLRKQQKRKWKASFKSKIAKGDILGFGRLQTHWLRCRSSWRK